MSAQITISAQNALETAASSPSPLELAGDVANKHAAAAVFENHRLRRSDNTNRAQAAALATFARFLSEAGVGGVTADTLLNDPQSWRGVTWGVVEAFRGWLLQQGYAVATVNLNLSSVKVYAKLAARAGVTPDKLHAAAGVEGIGAIESRHIDERRETTRVGHKKPEPTRLTAVDVAELKNLANYEGPQGARDCLLMCLLLDHGLRVSEVAGLQVKDFDMQLGRFRFYRPKVNMTQTHEMTADTLRTLRAYFRARPDAAGALLVGSLKSGELTERPLSTRAINKRVGVIAAAVVGIGNLSPHDCRHAWATLAIRNGTDVYALRDAGGWASLTMPSHYVAAQEIANEGVKLTP